MTLENLWTSEFAQLYEFWLSILWLIFGVRYHYLTKKKKKDIWCEVFFYCMLLVYLDCAPLVMFQFGLLKKVVLNVTSNLSDL
jgi:hypothetical protein